MNNEDLIDLFAGMALQGLLAKKMANIPINIYAKDAYDLAEAMIIEKEKRIERERPPQGN